MRTADLIGPVTGYRAELTDEGLVLYDVPIFCACAFDAGSKDEPKLIQFDEKWTAAAFKKSMRKQAGGYKSPMHIRHHDQETASNDSVRKAGYFKVVRTGVITLDGRKHTGIFADLVFTDPDAQHEVRTNQLNYRSVEIFDYTAAPSLDGLALLDHEAPHLELPMLQIDGPIADLRSPGSRLDHERDRQGVANANFQNQDAPAHQAGMVCFRRAGTTAYVTLQDTTVMQTPEQIVEEAEATEAARIANLGGDEAAPAAANLESDKDDDKDANLEADKDDADMDADGGDGIDWGAVAKALESGEIMAKDLELVLAAIQGSSAAEPAPTEEVVMAEEETEKLVMAAATLKAKTPELVAMAQMQGRMDAMEARDQQRDVKDKRVSDVATALTRLKGMPLGADIQGKLVKFHKAHGGAAFGDYVESLAQNTAIEPGDRDTTTAAFKALGGKVPAVAMKFQNDGTEAVNLASQFCREYQQLQESDARMRIDEETYVKNNMTRAQKIATETA